MKKLIWTLTLMSALLLAGCAGEPQGAGNNGIPDEAQFEAAAAELGEDAGTLKLSVNGKVYQFPMEMQTLLDDGWKVDGAVASQLKTIPGKTRTTTFAVNLKGADGYNGTKLHVVVSNHIDMDLKLGEVKVYSMDVHKEDGGTVILPRGITWESTFDEVKTAYQPKQDYVIDMANSVSVTVTNPETYDKLVLEFDSETKVLKGLKYSAHF